MTKHNGQARLMTYAEVPKVHENIYIGYVKSYNNLGISNYWGPSGSGIILGGVNGTILEHSVVYKNGGLDITQGDGGPVGIFAYDSTRVLMQYNESSYNRTGTKWDGGGFDFDHNVSNSIMQYNYSHNNDGPGYLLAHAPNDYNHTKTVSRVGVVLRDKRSWKE